MVFYPIDYSHARAMSNAKLAVITVGPVVTEPMQEEAHTIGPKKMGWHNPGWLAINEIMGVPQEETEGEGLKYCHCKLKLSISAQSSIKGCLEEGKLFLWDPLEGFVLCKNTH